MWTHYAVFGLNFDIKKVLAFAFFGEGVGEWVEQIRNRMGMDIPKCILGS